MLFSKEDFEKVERLTPEKAAELSNKKIKETGIVVSGSRGFFGSVWKSSFGGIKKHKEYDYTGYIVNVQPTWVSWKKYVKEVTLKKEKIKIEK